MPLHQRFANSAKYWTPTPSGNNQQAPLRGGATKPNQKAPFGGRNQTKKMSKTLYGFSASNVGELPAWFNSKKAALQFALQCGWDNVQLETADADDVDPSDILDKRSPTKRRSPTKAEELDALQEFIDSYHDDSYLKGWLVQVYGEVERNIRSDIYPTVSLAETDAECRKRLADCDAVIEQRKINAQRIIDADRAAAQRQHAAIIAEAERVAASLRDEAARKRYEVRNTLSGLRSLLDSLEG